MQGEDVRDKSKMFAWLLQRHVHEYIDVDGRPIGEGRSQAYSHIQTELKTCPFPGSRHHHSYPMNTSALNSILPHWPSILLLLSWLNQRYQVFQNTDIDTYYDLALVSGTGIFLSDYLVLRYQKPMQSQHIPVMLSGLYKVSLGFQQATFLAMMNDCFNRHDNGKILPDAKGFYCYLEEQKLLIGEGEVCGGSEAMISKAYEAMSEKQASSVATLPELAALNIDWDNYDRFTSHCSNLWRKAILFVIQMRGFVIELGEPELPLELRAAINIWFKNSFNELLTKQSGLTVDIAHLTLDESGRSLEEWFSVQEDFLGTLKSPSLEHASATTNENELAKIIMKKLAQNFYLAPYEALIGQAVSQQAAKYQTFEETVLSVFNEHLKQIFISLGHDHSGRNLMSSDLSSIYGKTIRNWPEFM